MAEVRTIIPDLYKDESSGALLNKSAGALNSYRAEKLKVKKIIRMEDDLDLLKNEISEIKEMLRSLANLKKE